MDSIQDQFMEHIRLLNQAATIASQPRTGAAADAQQLFDKAMAIPSLVDTTMVGHAVMRLIIDAALREGSEPNLHLIFTEHVGRLIPGAVISGLRRNQSNIPDFMVEVDGNKMPVEIKDHPIDQLAVDQLTRYINLFSDNGRGYLVGPQLSVELPEAMTFVKLDRERRWDLAGYVQGDELL
ncbi:hypothetical protein [Deinococcus petrolearius]|uniref:Uncharacterized protein n=1 Tax=Deinococcus petrolearius TaxID=1751295 RepID=A0ABW1DGB0_9DEIO